MTTQEVANKLVELCRQGKGIDAAHTLYAEDIVSVEATPLPDGSREMKGIGPVAGKTEWWMSEHVVHDAMVEGPLVAGPRFCVRFKFDVTNKKSGKRMTLDELGVYQVKDGKIIREEFFY